MEKMGSKEFQEVSEIEAFNLIGQDAETKGYDVVYFKSLWPYMSENFVMKFKYMHYIHLIKDEEMKYSIYFDEFNLGSIVPDGPYYELYDTCDIERFPQEYEKELFDRIKELI